MKFIYSKQIFSQGNQGPPGITGPVGAPGVGLQGEKVRTAGSSAQTEGKRAHIHYCLFKHLNVAKHDVLQTHSRVEFVLQQQLSQLHNL